MKHEESDEQIALFEWARLNEAKYPELKLMFAIANGGKRNVREAARLKKEGVKPGVLDIFLSVSKFLDNGDEYKSTYHHGLYIEMKSAKGKLSENQEWWVEQLRNQGYRVEVCRSWIEAKDVILDYLGG